MDYPRNSFKMYVNSFKNKHILIVLAVNILFILITTALVKLAKIISQLQIDKINKIDLNNILQQSEAQLQQIISTMRGFALSIILMLILLILLLIINLSLCQGIIYNILLKKKFNFRYFEKFLLLNIVWFIPWLILIFIILFGVKMEYFIILTLVLMLLFLHFSLILYVLFIKNNKLKEIKTALKIGVMKIHHFIIPYIFILITFIIISQLNLLKINLIIFIYLLFFSWVQNYTKDITLKLKT